MRKVIIILVLVLVLSAISSFAETLPSTSDAKRHWQIAQMYISEDAPEMAIKELEQLIALENYAPAYLKLAELYVASGKSDLLDKTEELYKDFCHIWPEDSDELKNIIELGKARNNLRQKKFYDSLIGNWHFEGVPLNESHYAMKIYRDFNGYLKVDVPKESFDGDVITAWQTTYFVQWDDAGLYLDHVNSSYGETYGISMIWVDSPKSYLYIQLYVPFEQPLINEGKLAIKYRSKYQRGQWANWENGIFIKD